MAGKHAPTHLEGSAKLWRDVINTYELSEDSIRALTLACESLDQANRARERLLEDGEYVTDRFGQLSAHPAVKVRNDALSHFRALMKSLDLAPMAGLPR